MVDEWKPQEPVTIEEIEQRGKLREDQPMFRVITNLHWLGHDQTFGVGSGPEAVMEEPLQAVQRYCNDLVRALEEIGVMELDDIEIKVVRRDKSVDEG